MKHTKLLVVALLVALLACLSMSAMAETAATQCDHACTWNREIILEAGCETTGIAVLRCSNCNGEMQRITIPATGHNWGETYTVQPTCGAAGRTVRKCTNSANGVACNHEQVIETLPATGLHTMVTYIEYQAPTCTAYGWTGQKKCSVCGYLGTANQQIPALGHNFDGVAWEVRPGYEATCADAGQLRRQCTRTGCTAYEYMNVGKTDYHTDSVGNAISIYDYQIIPAKAATCTDAGCKAVYQCPTCGAKVGGTVVAALGHNYNGQPWEVISGYGCRPATCATEGILGRKCIRFADCGSVETQNVGKTAYHTDKSGNPITITDYVILPAKAATCEKTGCKAVYQCPTCGKQGGGEKTAAIGHHITSSVWDPETTCVVKGKLTQTCDNPNCDKGGTIVTYSEPYGHSAVWQCQFYPTAEMPGIWQLVCTRCGAVLGVKYVQQGETAPSGTVNTGAAATAAATSTAKTSTTKTTSAKSSSTKSASTSASTKTAAAPATTETKKVATVAAVAAPAAELEANQAQLVADKHLYVVKNVAGEEIVLTVNVADGKITVEAALAEGESLVLYANAEAIENPTAENTLVLTANEAVELPEAFANAIVAVVKTESLPTAVAAK